MTFLEECRKAEDEDRVGKSKSKGKLKAAAATIPYTQNDELTKQLKKQQQQFDTDENFGIHFTNTNRPGLNIILAGKPFL